MLDCVERAITGVLHENAHAAIAGIGLSSPGPVDPYTGTVRNPSNLPCWRNFPLAAEVEKAYGFPVKVHNDANAAGLAEALWGAGVGFKCMFYATIGTGIGTAITYTEQLYLGRTGAAGEGGHMTIDYRGSRCRCGKRGCIETLAAGPAIAERARQRIAQDPARGERLLQLAGGRVEDVTSEIIAQAWESGDELATEILQETADLLAVWLGGIVDLLEPDVVVVGGGVSSLISHWFGRIRSQLPAWSVNVRCGEIPFFEAKYHADSGIVGAAALCVSRKALLIG
jgi:glucokinase